MTEKDEEQDQFLLDAIQELGKEYKLIYISLIASHMITGITAINRKYYTLNNFYGDVIDNFSLKYPGLSESEVKDLWTEFLNTMKKSGKTDLLDLFASRYIFYKTITSCHKDSILEDIRKSISTLNDTQKKAIAFYFNADRSDDFNKNLKEKMNIDFNEDIQELITSTGLMYKSTWISAKGNNLGSSFHEMSFMYFVKDIKQQWEFFDDFLNESTKLEEDIREIKEFSESLEVKPESISIFLSYADKDSDKFRVDEISKFLESKPEIEHAFYWERDAEDSISEFMIKYIKKSEVLLAFSSENTPTSNAVDEWKLVRMYRKKKVVPIFEDLTHVWELFRDNPGVIFNAEDLDRTREKIYQRILKAYF